MDKFNKHISTTYIITKLKTHHTKKNYKIFVYLVIISTKVSGMHVALGGKGSNIKSLINNQHI
jgi:hypothetical protein